MSERIAEWAVNALVFLSWSVMLNIAYLLFGFEITVIAALALILYDLHMVRSEFR